MKLFSSKLEKTLRRRIRQEIRRSPELKKEAKRQKRRQSVTSMMSGTAVAAGGVAVGLNSVAARAGFASQLVYCALASFVLVNFMIIVAKSTRFSPNDLTAFYYLPASKEQIFRRQWRAFVRKTSGLPFVFLVMFGTLGFYNHFDAREWLSIAFLAIVQWAISLVSAAVLPGYFSWFQGRLTPILGLGGLAVMGFMIFVPERAEGLYNLLPKIAEMPYWVIPTGWIAFLLEQFRAEHYWMVTGGLVMVGLFCLALRPALQKLLADYIVPESSFICYEAMAREQAEALEEGIEATSPFPGSRIGPTEIEDSIRDGAFLKPTPPEKMPWLDSFVTNLLSSREKMLMEFLAHGSRWADQWKMAAIFTAVLVLYARIVSYQPPVWVFAMLSFFFIGRFLPLENPIGRGFVPMFFNGTNVRWYSGFPISFQEMSRLIIKLHFIRLLAFAPLLLIFGVGTAMLYHLDWHKGLILTLKIIVVLAAFLPARVIFYFSSGTNDTSRGGGKVILGTLLGVLMLLVFLGLGAVTIFAKNQMWVWSSSILATGVSTLLYLYYKRLFNRGSFDLMQVPK